MKKNVVIKIACFAGSAIYAALCALFFPLGLMLLPALLAYAAAALGFGAFALAALLSACGVFVACGFEWVSAAGALLIYLPAACLLAYLLARKRPYRSAVALCSAAFTLALYALVCLPSLLAGDGPFAAVTEYVEQFGAAILETAEAMQLDAQGMDMIRRLVAALPYAAPDTATLTMIAIGMAFALANVMLARMLLVCSGCDAKKMARFSEWQLSASFMQGSFILLLGALIVQMTNIENNTAIVTAIECIVGAPYALMGACTIAFMYRIRSKTRTFLTIACIALVLLMPYSAIGLCIIGASDRLFGIRRAYLARNNDKDKHQS